MVQLYATLALVSGVVLVGRRKSRTLTEVELEFMQVMWDEGKELTPEDFRATFEKKGRHLAGPSIRKMLQILMEKGYVDRRRSGRGHAYRPLVTKRRALRQMARHLLRRAFGGNRALMISSIMEGETASESDLQSIQELMDRYTKAENAEDQ